MSIVPLLEQWLWWVSIVAYAGLYLRLRHEGLDRVYRWFTIYVVFCVVLSVALIFVPQQTNLYAQVWMATAPVVDILYVLVVLELVSLILQRFRGIASLGRWAVLAGLSLGILIASLTLSPDLSNPAEQSPILRYFFVLQRGVTSSLVLFLLFITVFLVWYPVPLSRNLITHSAVYAVYFLCTSVAFLFRNLAGSTVTSLGNVVLSGTNVACLVAWMVLLNRAGEQRAVTVKQHWDAEQQQHLIDQLAAINASLLRTARK